MTVVDALLATGLLLQFLKFLDGNASNKTKDSVQQICTRVATFLDKNNPFENPALLRRVTFRIYFYVTIELGSNVFAYSFARVLGQAYPMDIIHLLSALGVLVTSFLPFAWLLGIYSQFRKRFVLVLSMCGVMSLGWLINYSVIDSDFVAWLHHGGPTSARFYLGPLLNLPAFSANMVLDYILVLWLLQVIFWIAKKAMLELATHPKGAFAVILNVSTFLFGALDVYLRFLRK